jgi:hypothetical protein
MQVAKTFRKLALAGALVHTLPEEVDLLAEVLLPFEFVFFYDLLDFRSVPVPARRTERNLVCHFFVKANFKALYKGFVRGSLVVFQQNYSTKNLLKLFRQNTKEPPCVLLFKSLL